MVSFNHGSGRDLCSRVDISKKDLEDAKILDFFDKMSTKQFVDYVDRNPRDLRAYSYLFELLDDNDRIDEIIGLFEKRGMLQGRDELY